MLKKLPLFILLFLLLTKNTTFAARSLYITSDKSSLKGYEEILISASPSGFTSDETVYVKGAFFESNCTSSCNYFGYTKDGDNWTKNSESALNQKQIKIGEWDGYLTVKSDFLDNGYKGKGDYKLKVGFYYLTGSGNSSSVNWSNSIDVFLNDPDPTSTPIPSNTPTPTQKPTLIPTKTPTPVSTKTPTPTEKSTTTSSNLAFASTNTPTQKLASNSSLVLGQKTLRLSTPSSTITPTKKEDRKEQKKNNLPAFILISIGIVFITTCAILGYLFYKKKKIKEYGK